MRHYAASVGIPGGRCLPFALGIYTRRTGRGCQDAMDWCARTATVTLAGPSSATTPSTPAVARPALRWVACPVSSRSDLPSRATGGRRDGVPGGVGDRDP